MKNTSIFFADAHLGHQLSSTQRGFNSVEDHDNQIISNIIDSVNRGDNLYSLGDFVIKNSPRVDYLLNELKKKKINLFLIEGNHDRKINHSIIKTKSQTKFITVEEQGIFLCHYPMLVWNKSHYNSWQLFGHVHLNDPTDLKFKEIDYTFGKQMNINLDFTNLKPLSFEEIRLYMKNQPDNFDLIRR